MDYTDTHLIKGYVDHTVIANASTVISLPGYAFTKTIPFLVKSATVRLRAVAATDRTHTFKVQLSDSAGAFSSPTDLIAVSIATTDAAAAILFTRAADTVALVNQTSSTLYAVRFVHVASGTDATLDYDFQVVVSRLSD